MRRLFIESKIMPVMFVATLGIFTILAISSSITYRPEVDEGMFASPAMNLATEGHLGTTILDTSGTKLTRIEQRTYWVMPLFLLNAAAFFKVFGASLFTFRLVSTFWGLVLLISWYVVVLKLSKSKSTALLAMTLIAFSYLVIVTASMARMDIMSASLGFAGISAFLALRERSLTLAIIVSQTLVVLSGLTHSNGILAFAGLIFLTIYFDYSSLRPKHILFAAVPYIIGGLGFGLWVLQDPTAFRDQFLDNAAEYR